ncbi:MAG: hypothetical protein DRN53_08415 [Thermoprotei archaeon]|nr:MAG: hypothetical protein DRN53_08415 [Thermoprotei archaeon]
MDIGLIAEIGTVIVLVTFILSIYSLQLSMSSLTIAVTQTDLVKFIGVVGLGRIIFDVEDMWELIEEYKEYNNTLGLRIVPALCINLTTNSKVVINVMSWSRLNIPYLNYTITRYNVSEGSIDPIGDYESGVLLPNGTGKTDLDYEVGDLYVVLIKMYRMYCYRIFITDNNTVKTAYWYDYENEEIDVPEGVEVTKIYCLVPHYSWLIEFNPNCGAEYGTVAYILETSNDTIYLVPRVPMEYDSGQFTVDLFKYINCEYYTYMVEVGRR